MMNCATMFPAFGGHPQPSVRPVDLAVHLCLGQGQPFYQLLAMSPAKPRKPHQPAYCLSKTGSPSPQHSSSSSSSSSTSSSMPPLPKPSEPRSCFRRDGMSLNKKRVVFADSKGLHLTTVRLFVPEPSAPPTNMVSNPSLANLQGQQLPAVRAQRYKLRLGFPQPMLDFKSFLARLKETLVQLESCSVTERSLSGTVRVCNTCPEKAVHIRVTFDSWQSHHDVPCKHLQQCCRGLDTKVYSFDLALPQSLDPNKRVEFCVSVTPTGGTATQWDDNGGLNYRVCVEADEMNAKQGTVTCRSRGHTVRRLPSWALGKSLTVKNSAALTS